MQVVFYICAGILVLAVSVGTYMFRQLGNAHSLNAVVTPVAVASAPNAAPQGAPSGDDLVQVISRVRQATVEFTRDNARAFVADETQIDGGLDRGLVKPYIKAPLAGTSVVFWRVLNSSQGLVLCAQYLEPDARVAVENSLIGAADAAGAPLLASACGPSAVGVGLSVPRPVLAPLPPLLPQVQITAVESVTPATSVAAATCQNDAAIEEQLMRLL